MNANTIKRVSYRLAIVVLTVGIYSAYSLLPALAADTDFSDVITVDSNLDTPDANVDDGICDDGSGNCTLRAAIQEANATAGPMLIDFNITGTPDFTNNGQNGYTIQPQTALPALTDTVTIDGYSQPGAQANTAIAPNPLNGTLLIEIDGSEATGTTNDGLRASADNITIRGLVINNWTAQGISVAGSNLTIQGNYIGTDPDGLIARGNAFNGVGHGVDNSTDTLIGGLNPEDRNLISGNIDGGSSPNTGSDNWTYYGNYIGVDATGMDALPNAQPGGSGGLSLDNSDGHIVGGTQVGAINVISGNASHGIAPLNVSNLVIQGNYIGVGADGVTPIANGFAGITLADNSDVMIGGANPLARNIISNNASEGIFVGESSDVLIQGNTILDNDDRGIFVLNSSNTTIGGTTEGASNHITNNGINIWLLGSGQGSPGISSGTVIQGNYIGVDENGNVDESIVANDQIGIQALGLVDDTLIGGNNPLERNIIAGNSNFGIGVEERTATAFSVSLTPTNISILGNSIYDNKPGSYIGSAGLGIDLYTSLDESNPPNNIVDSFTNLGPTLNDLGDTDTGPNSYINFPVINNVVQDGFDVSIDFDLDAAGSTLNDQYRVEFFANDEADSSGYGEGQTYLGYATVENGNNEVNLTVGPGTDLTDKVLSSTTTALSDTTTSGFGSTSEFSLVSDITVLAPAPLDTSGDNDSTQGSLAETGSSTFVIAIIGLSLMLFGTAGILYKIRT